MPMSGSTRMLRARRKDCNVKPNRRLDRKSSRGMLYENEELRMRTITINAEVEQGQHALKKLRRENEQLRREMWCLRDEYDKMEKLLRKRDTDEDSDQENSDSDVEDNRSDESEEKKKENKEITDQKEENPDLENEENLQKSSEFENGTNVRSFDGLSVIDEQTEETQTTESAPGYGTLSRGNSAVRTFNFSNLYEDRCGLSELPQFDYDSEAYAGKAHLRKKSPCIYDNRAFAENWNAGTCDTYETRPPSPYPHNGSLQNSYQKRFQVLQDLSVIPQASGGIGKNGWIFSDTSKLPEMPDYNMYVNSVPNYENNYANLETMCSVSNYGYGMIENRTGPDVFVTDGYPQPGKRIGDTVEQSQIIYIPKENSTKEVESINNVEAEIDRIEISQKSERDPKAKKMTTLTKPPMPRAEGESTRIPGDAEEVVKQAKLTIDKSVDKNDNEISKHVQQLVSCQISDDRDVCESIGNIPEVDLPDEMPLTEKPGNSKYQTKLTVTLKTPTAKPEPKVSKKVATPIPPKNFQQQFRYGIKPEYALRFQTFPSPRFQNVSPRPIKNGRDCMVNHYAGVRTPANGFSGTLPRQTNLITKTEMGFDSTHIPVVDLEKEINVSPNEESLAVPVAQPLVKPVKIPPAPPPRTSSCPKTIIPAPSVGVSAFNHKTLKRGKQMHHQNFIEQQEEPVIYNPLLLSQPIATSSPTISLKASKYNPNSSTENLYWNKFRKPIYNEESSLEDFSKQKFNFRQEFPRVDVPRLNKSVSSPSFGSFRSGRRKQSMAAANSIENILGQTIPEVMNLPEKNEKKTSKNHATQNNVSMSSSSGLDSPGKNGRRKRRVSIQFKKKQSHTDDDKDSTDRRDSMTPGILLVKGSDRHKLKGKLEETDATTSDRERTNSVSSRTSSVAAGSSKRKFSFSSNRTYFNEEKIPWCGCWGNGCV